MNKQLTKFLLPSFAKNRIGRRLVVATIIFGSVIMLTTTSCQLYADYRKDLKTIQGYFALIQDSYIASLSRSVWMYDARQIDAQLEGLAKLPDMEYLQIEAGKGYHWSSGAPHSKRSITRRFPLTFRHKDRTYPIGTLKATASLDNVYDRLIGRTFTLLAANTIQAFFVCGFILLIFRFFVTRHLVELAEAVEEIDFSRLPERIGLKKKRSRQDEIDQVVQAVNQMQEKLFDSYQALKNSEDELNRIFTLSLDPICIVDIETATFLRVNPAFGEILGYSQEELTARSFLEFLHPQDVEATRKNVQEKLQSGQKIIGFENRYRSKDGTYRWLRWVSHPVPEKGVSYAVGHDITDRKIGEQRIGHLNKVLLAIRNVNQLIVHERDPDTLIHEGCRLLVEHRGYVSALIVRCDENDRPVSWASAGLSDSCASLDTLLQNGRLPPCCGPVRQAGDDVQVLDGTSVCRKCAVADGCEETQSLCVKLAHEGRGFGYLVAQLEDEQGVDDDELQLFTELAGDLAYALNMLQTKAAGETAERNRKSLEGQLLQAQKLESVGRLAGGVAHDYNNMLGVIMGYAELALDKLGPREPLRDDILEILAAAKRSTNITRQLLAFARKQTIAPKVLDLNETVESMLKMLQRLLGEDIDIAWHPRTGIGPVKMDPTQIDQMLANLCVNARDAIADVGKITIETDTTSIDASYCAEHAGFIPGDFTVLAVSDDGCGMEREALDKIFEPFYTTKAVGRGTGLGLATVYGIVKQNEGFINVYSEPGKGTTFKIYLPRHAGLAMAKQETTIGKMPTGSTETVMVVEDEDMILKLTNRMLSGLGYRVLMAKSPSEALKLAAAHNSEIVLAIIDVIMPDMNGRELIERLKTIHPGLKHLFMSGYTVDVIAHRGILEEGFKFIQKPFSITELALKVREALE